MMTEVGHNAPPPFEAISLEIEDLFTLVSDSTAGGQVATDEQEAALDELLDQFRAARKKADGERVSEKRPHDDAAKAVEVPPEEPAAPTGPINDKTRDWFAAQITANGLTPGAVCKAFDIQSLKSITYESAGEIREWITANRKEAA